MEARIVKGHGFSRANNADQNNWALAPAKRAMAELISDLWSNI